VYVKVCLLKENLSFTGDDSPMATLLLSVMGGFAEFERALIRERQREGIAIAKTKGVYRGRKPAPGPEQADELVPRAGNGESKSMLAREFGISRETAYVYCARGRPIRETPAAAGRYPKPVCRPRTGHRSPQCGEPGEVPPARPDALFQPPPLLTEPNCPNYARALAAPHPQGQPNVGSRVGTVSLGVARSVAYWMLACTAIANTYPRLVRIAGHLQRGGCGLSSI
jgi:hypothetical protein